MGVPYPELVRKQMCASAASTFSPCFLFCFLPPSPSSPSFLQQLHLHDGRSREGAAKLKAFEVLGQSTEQ